jgi:purine-binding chemotaxis protein CheW
MLGVLTVSPMVQLTACADGTQLPVSEILIFTVDDRHYGLSTACVQELARAVRSVSVPNPIDGVEGVIDLHGQIIPVIDLRRRLGLAPKEPQPADHLIIVRTPTRLVAIRADCATDVRRVAPEMIQAMPDACGGAGIIRMPDGLVMLLDPMLIAAGSTGEHLPAAVAARGGK